MKQTIFNILATSLCAMAFPICATAANNQPASEKTATEIPADSIINLKEPDKSLSTTLMQALSDRRSEREFSNKPISLETLSSLLWAANGINRDDGRRTAPSAVNSQDIDIYVCLATGAYLYDAKQNRLVRICTDDLRQSIAGRQPMAAPVFLVMVGDVSRYPQGLAAQRQLVESFACMDAGYVSGNIGLYCAAARLATVPRASMDKAALTKALKLTDNQILILNNPVGYARE